MPDYFITYLSRFLNFTSLGSYLVIKRNYFCQSYSEGEAEDPDDPDEEEEEDDSFLFRFFAGFYSFG
jgi:hypothetical protein